MNNKKITPTKIRSQGNLITENTPSTPVYANNTNNTITYNNSKYGIILPPVILTHMFNRLNFTNLQTGDTASLYVDDTEYDTITPNHELIYNPQTTGTHNLHLKVNNEETSDIPVEVGQLICIYNTPPRTIYLYAGGTHTYNITPEINLGTQTSLRTSNIPIMIVKQEWESINTLPDPTLFNNSAPIVYSNRNGIIQYLLEAEEDMQKYYLLIGNSDYYTIHEVEQVISCVTANGGIVSEDNTFNTVLESVSGAELLMPTIYTIEWDNTPVLSLSSQYSMNAFFFKLYDNLTAGNREISFYNSSLSSTGTLYFVDYNNNPIAISNNVQVKIQYNHHNHNVTIKEYDSNGTVTKTTSNITVSHGELKFYARGTNRISFNWENYSFKILKDVEIW